MTLIAPEPPTIPDRSLPSVVPDTPTERPVHDAPAEASGRGLAVTWLALAVLAAVILAFVLGRVTASDPVTVIDPSAVSAQGPTVISPIGGDSGQVAAVASAASGSVVQIETDGGVGSGVIYDPSGLILTAAHVVADAETVAVRLADGRQFPGAVVGAHTLTDIAVIRIESPDPFPTAVLGYNDQLQVGELAVALGSPFGLDQTVTAGIVSAVSRPVNGIPMVQTDAAINPGNSGGPLLDGDGRVIGINDVIFTQGGGSDGIGFAVSIDIAIVVADQLVAGDNVQLSGLGVSTIASTTGDSGAIVRQLASGSPAEVAGLEIGDRIIAMDGEPIRNPMQLFAAVVTRRPGTDVTIDLMRGARQLQLAAFCCC
jgi:S1-C subfamily serine protease